MKKIELLTLSLLLLSTGLLFAQDNWTQKANFIGNRGASVSFTLDGKGYAATGYDDFGNYYQDNWAYDPATNVWTQKADFPAGGRYGATGFSVNNIGYLATGVGPGGTFYNDLWAFDASSNAWAPKASLPAAARYYAVGFSIQGSGFVGTGSSMGAYYNDLWEYNVAHDAWIPKAALPTAGRHMATAFAIDNKAYVGTGMLSDDSRQKDLWQYDATIDTWTRMTDLPGSERYAAAGFVIGQRGYISSGFLYAGLQDVWEYYPAGDSWTQRASLTTAGRAQAVGFGIGNKGYFGTGSDGSQFNNDFYEYTPPDLDGYWSQMADFPNGGRFGAVAVSAGNKGYLALGATDAGYQKDLWEFDPGTEVWTQKADFPGTERQAAVAFAVGYKVYVGTGINMYSPFNDFYAFDPASNQWATIASYPGGPRYAAMAFSIGNKGYMGCGKDEQLFQGNYDFYEYDPLTDVWTRKADVGTVLRSTGVGFSVGNKGYIAFGFEGYDTRKSDLWEFDPTNGPDGSWTQKPDLPAEVRFGGVGLGLGSLGYVIGGANTVNFDETWSYDPRTETWKNETSFFTSGRTQAIGFAIDSIAYYGLGMNQVGLLRDMWKFAPPVACEAWTQLPDFPGTKRANPVPFSIGNMGYITTGSGPLGLMNDTWAFDPIAKYWTQKADFPGIPRQAAVGFVINNKAYVGTGLNMYTTYSDFFEYDPVQNLWTPKAAYPAGSRYHAMAFSIGNKGYVGGGKDQNLNMGTAEFYEYDPATDTWTQKANAGPVLRSSGVGFSIGNKGYIGLGAEGYDTRKKDLWQFDPTVLPDGAWIQKNDFPGTERYEAFSFTIQNKAFVGSGWNQTLLNDLWIYHAATDTWEAKTAPPEMTRGAAAAFSIQNKAYIGFGMDNADYVNTFWEYNSCISPIIPTLACVEDRMIYSTAASCSQTVDNLDPIILPEGASAVVNYSISRNGEVISSGTGSVSGFTFAQGVNSVTYSLPEYPGQTCTFIVDVKDTLRPVVVCPPAQLFCYSPSNSYVLPAMTATDNCGIQGVTFSITGATTRNGTGYNASGTFNPGRSYINWVVKDIAGNTSTCTTEVRVDQPLQVVVPDVTVVFFGGMPNTVYRGYGPSCITLTAYPSGGTRFPGGQYRYKWSNGATTRSITVCPTVFGANNYMVTVTDSLGCQAYVTKTIKLVDVRCGPRNNEVLICWNRRTQACYTQGQAFLALLLGAQLGSCSPAPAEAAIVNTDLPVENVLPAVSVFPNPSNGTFAIQLKNINAKEIRIVDQAGRIVARQAVSGINPTQTIPMQMAKLGKGVFLVQAISSKGIHTCKLVIQ